jgi:hypothetical protein
MMIPFKLFIPFLCFTEIFSGRLSPGKHPDLSSSIVAVIVLSSKELLLPRWLSLAHLADDGAGASLRLEAVPPLDVLSVTVGVLIVLRTSLGAEL